MSTQPLDLRPPSIRARVERRRAFARSTRLSLALALITAVGVAAAEAVRDDAAHRLAQATLAANHTADVRALLVRTNSDVAAAVRSFADDRRVPLERVLALVCDEMTDHLELVRLVASEGDSTCILEFEFRGAADDIAERLAARAPWLEVENEGTRLRLVLPRTVPFEIVHTSPEAEAGDVR